MHPALIIGFNIHGLALARALARRGVEVHALAQDEALPGMRTKCAQTHYRDGINSPELIPILLAFANEALRGQKAVLLPTNDNMVRQIGQHWDLLAPHYLLSWADRRDTVLRLLDKDKLPELCEALYLPHPRSLLIDSETATPEVCNALTSPALIKPWRPQSGFKAQLVRTPDEIDALRNLHAKDLPFLAQDWIAGSDGSLYFCTAYASDGEVTALYCGRKLRSDPPGTGQGLIVATEDNDEVETLSRRLIRQLRYSGPIAVEWKKDPAGRYWLIEPNVGRTEYCADVGIQSGVNLPYIEYCDAVSQTCPDDAIRRTRDVVWYDTDKAPLCFVTECLREMRLRPHRKMAVFPYFGHGDAGPLLARQRGFAGSLWRRMTGA